MARRSPTLRMKGKLRSRTVIRKAKVRRQRMKRTKVRHHNHRRYAGVRGVGLRGKRLRRKRLKPRKPSAKHRVYRKKPLGGTGLPPISTSTYLSMF